MLESRHVIGLFLLMLLFSAVFFSLGYVMARNQYAGQVRADGGKDGFVDPPATEKPEAAAKRSAGMANRSSASNASKDTGEAPVASSDWDNYSAEKPKPSDNRLKLAAPPAVSPEPRTSTLVAGNRSANGKSAAKFSDNPRTTQSSSAASGGNPSGYNLQVAAVRREADALDLAKRLQKKKFPAFVLSPQGNKYYRVQVGPYADQKSAEAAKKGLENAGFRAIVKHG